MAPHQFCDVCVLRTADIAAITPPSLKQKSPPGRDAVRFHDHGSVKTKGASGWGPGAVQGPNVDVEACAAERRHAAAPGYS